MFNMKLLLAIAVSGITLVGLLSCSAVGQPTSPPTRTVVASATPLPTQTLMSTIADTEKPEPTSTGFLPAGPITITYPPDKAVLANNLLPYFQYTAGSGAIMSRVTVKNDQGFCINGSGEYYTSCVDDKTMLPWPLALSPGSYSWNVYAASAAYSATSETYTFIVK